MEVIFNAEDHSYRTPSGVRLPSVTQILSAVGYIDARWFNDAACLRGQCVHKEIANYNNGTLADAGSSDPYVAAWAKFLKETGARVLEFETPHAHELYGYAGTPDVLLDWNGDICLPDIKSGAAPKATRIQTAAYSLFYPQAKSIRRFALEVKDTGKYKLSDEYTDNHGDLNKFMAALTVYNTRREFGTLEG